MPSNVTPRLLEAVQAVVPAVAAVSIGTVGNSATVKVVPANQQAAAQATINAFDWSQAAQDSWQNLKDRTAADSSLNTDTDRYAKLFRAVASVLVDEINALRQRDIDRAADVAAATNLANLQTRWAAETAFTLRTLAQAKTAIQNKIDDGSAD